MAHVQLTGSEKNPLVGAKEIGPTNPNDEVEITLLLRHTNDHLLKDHLSRLKNGERFARHFSREDIAYHFPAMPVDVESVEKFAADNGLLITQVDRARRTIMLKGTLENLSKAFKVELKTFEYEGKAFRGREGVVHIPEELHDIVEAILGLDNRPQAKPHFRIKKKPALEAHVVPKDMSGTFTPLQLAQLYNFPIGDGAGQCIAIIELGGGFTQSDLDEYFSSLGILNPPKVTAVSVDGGLNAPTGDPNGPDGEVMLDIEVAGAIAPGAHIIVYFAGNTDQGFVNAISQAAHDNVNKPSVISISWGGSESNWTVQAMTAMDEAIAVANSMGITVCVASGDNGSSDGQNDGQDHVDFPASSPNSLGCGGTSLHASGNNIASESVWNDGAEGGAGGGGMSTNFLVPLWQNGIKASKNGVEVALSGRGVPDVCGDADPQTGYNVRIDGQDTVIGGTSAVAPLWAGLIARINSIYGKSVGFINPLLYKNVTVLNDITVGNNGDFDAAPGWDAASGLGSPNGVKISAYFTATKVDK